MRLQYTTLLLLLLLIPLSQAQTYYYAGNSVVAVKEDGQESPTYLYSDRLGTESTTQNLPFGQIITEGERFGYTGKEEDSSGLHYYGARYYDTETGRFTSTDPVEETVPYQYVHNNPVNLVDPNGESAEILTGIFVGMSAFPEPSSTALGLAGLAVLGAGSYVASHKTNDVVHELVKNLPERRAETFENRKCLNPCTTTLPDEFKTPSHTGHEYNPNTDFGPLITEPTPPQDNLPGLIPVPIENKPLVNNPPEIEQAIVYSAKKQAKEYYRGAGRNKLDWKRQLGPATTKRITLKQLKQAGLELGGTGKHKKVVDSATGNDVYDPQTGFVISWPFSPRVPAEHIADNNAKRLARVDWSSDRYTANDNEDN